MAMRHQNVWDDVGEDTRFGYARPPPARGGGRLGGPPNGLPPSRRGAPPPPPSAAPPPLAFAADSVEAKLAMGLGELLLKKGVPASALLGSGIDVARLGTPEPRGSRFQRLSRLAALPAGKALLNGALPPTARSVEQLTLTAEIHCLETEMAARQQFEHQSAMRLMQADLNAERASRRPQPRAQHVAWRPRAMRTRGARAGDVDSARGFRRLVRTAGPDGEERSGGGLGCSRGAGLMACGGGVGGAGARPSVPVRPAPSLAHFLPLARRLCA